MRIKATEPAHTPEPFNEEDIQNEEPVTNEPSPKERKTSNVVLIVLAVFLLVFITTMIVTFWVKGSVPDTLIQYTMGAGGLEALLLAGIKISKVIKHGLGDDDLPGDD